MQHLTLRICKPCEGKTWPPGAARKGEMYIFRPRQNAAPRGQAQGLHMRWALGVIKMKMIRKALLVLILLPSLLVGQSKESCYALYNRGKVCLAVSQDTINDTIISYNPIDCYTVVFDSLAKGQWKIFYTDSVLIEILSLKDGLRNGKSTKYYRSGQVECISNYVDGKLSGTYHSYYESGKIHYSGFVTIDGFTGTVYQFWDNGNLSYKFSQVNGYPAISDKFWDPEGNLIDYKTYCELWYGCK